MVLLNGFTHVLILIIHRFAGSILNLWLRPQKNFSRQDVWKQLVYLNCSRSFYHTPAFARRFLRVCLSYQCNGSCSGCYARGLEQQMPQQMKLEDFLKLLVWAKEKGWRAIHFVGGEPTIHPEFLNVLESCYRQKIFVTLSTNNLFSSPMVASFDNFYNLGVTVNYSAQVGLSLEKKQLFERNLELMHQKNISYGFAYTLDPQQSDLDNLFIAIRRFKPLYVKTTLLLPDFLDYKAEFLGLKHKDMLFQSLISLQKECVKNKVVFFNFRPIPQCLFSQEQWNELNSYSSLVSIPRCEIGYKGDYTYFLTVNPDLTLFPCPSIFISAGKAFDFKNRKQINNYFKNALEPLCLIPTLSECARCEGHKKYLATFQKGNLNSVPKFFNESACQGGCLTYKWHVRRVAPGCRVEEAGVKNYSGS